MSHVLGVDGGNTKTIALIATIDGEIVGRGRSGCGDMYYRGAKLALSNVEAAVEAALVVAGLRREDLLAGAFSMAGADWPEDISFLGDAFTARDFGATITVVNDAMGALRAGSLDGTGVSVVCGTGVGTGACSARGDTWHTSFWQEAGGAVSLGEKTLRAVYHAELGLAPPTALSGLVLRHTRCASVEQLLHMLTARERDRRGDAPLVGGLARVLLDAAAQGDETAERIICAHGVALGEYALVAARRVGIEREPFHLVLAGGVLRHPARELTDAIVSFVRSGAPDVHPVNCRFEPAVGALFLALEAAGVMINDGLLSRLVPTLPEPSLYLT